MFFVTENLVWWFAAALGSHGEYFDVQNSKSWKSWTVKILQSLSKCYLMISWKQRPSLLDNDFQIPLFISCLVLLFSTSRLHCKLYHNHITILRLRRDEDCKIKLGGYDLSDCTNVPFYPRFTTCFLVRILPTNCFIHRYNMKFCGPKLSLCGIIISIWGIIQLVCEFFACSSPT